MTDIVVQKDDRPRRPLSVRWTCHYHYGTDLPCCRPRADEAAVGRLLLAADDADGYFQGSTETALRRWLVHHSRALSTALAACKAQTVTERASLAACKAQRESLEGASERLTSELAARTATVEKLQLTIASLEADLAARADAGRERVRLRKLVLRVQRRPRHRHERRPRRRRPAEAGVLVVAGRLVVLVVLLCRLVVLVVAGRLLVLVVLLASLMVLVVPGRLLVLVEARRLMVLAVAGGLVVVKCTDG